MFPFWHWKSCQVKCGRVSPTHSGLIPVLGPDTVVADKHPLGVPLGLDAQQSVVVVLSPELILPLYLEEVCFIEVSARPRCVLPEWYFTLLVQLKIGKYPNYLPELIHSLEENKSAHKDVNKPSPLVSNSAVQQIQNQRSRRGRVDATIE